MRTTRKYLAVLLVMVTFCGCGGEELQTLTGHAKLVTSVAFSPDGKRIVSGCRDGEARIWDAETGKKTLTLKGQSGYVYSVAFSSDENGSQVETMGIRRWFGTADRCRLMNIYFPRNL